MSEGKIVFHIQDLKKSYDMHEVLKGITLAFLEGAKIGLIGANGAGKSTLLKIIAGVDKEFEGIAKPIAGTSVGYLSQEPPLNEEKTVGENIDEAVTHLRAIEARYYEVMGLMGGGREARQAHRGVRAARTRHAVEGHLGPRQPPRTSRARAASAAVRARREDPLGG